VSVFGDAGGEMFIYADVYDTAGRVTVKSHPLYKIRTDYVSPEINGSTVTIRYPHSSGITNVHLMGNFTTWDLGSLGVANSFISNNGYWQFVTNTIGVGSGTHHYKILVNRTSWMEDYANPNNQFANYNDSLLIIP